MTGHGAKGEHTTMKASRKIAIPGPLKALSLPYSTDESAPQRRTSLRRSIKQMSFSFAGLGLLVTLQYAIILWYSAGQLDQREVDQTVENVAAVLQRKTALLASGAREHAWWNDTIDKLIESQDQEWIEFNFGQGLVDNYGISEWIALDANRKPVSSTHLHRRSVTDPWLGWQETQLLPIIQATQASSLISPTPYVSFLVKAGELHMVAACAITATDADMAAASDSRWSRPTLIFSSSLDQAFIDELREELGLTNLQWSTWDLGMNASLPITDEAGKTLGYLNWNSPQPGTLLIGRVVMWSMPILLCCLYLGSVVIKRFRKVIKRYQEVNVRSAVVKQSQHYFQSMADNAPVLIWQTDLRGRIVYCNRAFIELWNSSNDGTMPSTLHDMAEGAELRRLLEFFSAIIQSEESVDHECQLNNTEQRQRWLAMVGTPQLAEPGQVASVLFSASDITERKDAEELAWQRANYDALTQLPNRSLFQDRLDIELAKAQRSGSPLGLMFIDLDNFKNINDSLGHGMGDIVLQQAAGRISSCMRKPDTVCRLGGDEFVVLAPGMGIDQNFGKVAQRIKESLSSQFHIDNVETYLSASIGIAVYPQDGLDGETLMMNADTAMYRAKHNGRNGIVYYDASMNEELKAAIKMESELRQALRENQFYLEYQPIYDSGTITIAGVEALCRWRGTDGNMVPPETFIPIVERAGLMNELGDQLLVMACKQLRDWLRDGRDLYVAVNISPAQFNDKAFPERIAGLIQEYGIEPERLQLELTERLLLDDSEDIVMMLNRLAECGVKLAVDDFGTGYSALSYLRRFPVHVLKVDRSFIREVPGSLRDQALVKAIIAMAHSLDMRVVAEGVETREQRDFLITQNCELMQGYFYGRPTAAANIWNGVRQLHTMRETAT